MTNIFALLLICLPLIKAYTEVPLDIPLGHLIGKEVITPKGNKYFSFQRVPYAEPPVGDLRFQAPVPIKNSRKTYNNTNGDVICYQTDDNVSPDYAGIESEDCLFVNIYTPKLPDGSKHVSLPVFAYIYGGSFQVGNANQKGFGPDFMIDEEVIVVTINYRVGALGFLSTGDTVIPGNAGLKDQFLALKWIHENIKYFGGDASRITIGGESAGAAAVIFHVLNKKAEGLFSSALTNSGSGLALWAIQRNPRSAAFNLSMLVKPNVKPQSSEEVRQILVNATNEEIRRADVQMLNSITFGILKLAYFIPVLEVEHEGAFMTESPYELLVRGDFNKVPLLTGITSEEALGLTGDEEAVRDLGQELDSNPSSLVPVGINLAPNVTKDALGLVIRNLYLTPGESFTKNLARTLRFSSDNAFNRPVIKTAELMAKWNKVYFYQFSFEGTMTFWPKIHIEGADRVPHVSEHGYFWRMTEESLDNTDLSKFTKDDIITHDRVVKLFTNFMKYQNPTPSSDCQEIIWPSTSETGRNHFPYLNINTTLEVRNYPKGDTYKLWQQVYNTYAVRPYVTF